MPEGWDELERDLDDALASYADAPATEGLEQRVLGRVTGRKAREGSVLAWAAALCIVAAGYSLFWPQPNSPPRKEIQAVRTASSNTERLKIPPRPSRELVIASANARKPRRRVKTALEPKLPSFPTPFPITNEEKALLQLTRGDQRLIARELTHLGDPIEPIQVTEVQIRPLD